MIVPVKGGFKIKSEKTGKLWPKVYPSRKIAQKRIDQMKKFKHMKKSFYVILTKRRLKLF